MIDLTTIYALLATFAAGYAAQRAWHWHQSYIAALRMFSTLPSLSAPTPHQRGAQTRRLRDLERKRRHRLELQRSMEASS